MDTKIQINPERLVGDLRKLAEFGKVGTGVHRLAFSQEDIDARNWLCRRMAEAGLDAAVDGVGNVFGRSPVAGPCVLIGSHVDSVPNGGWLDGALGVIYGLEIARATLDSANGSAGAVDVIAFQDEEGTYLPLLGSRSFCAELDEAEIDAAHNPAGGPLRDALNAGDFTAKARARIDNDRYRAYLEAHIEQGPKLEAAGQRIGVVSAIVGIRRYRIDVAGEADHAGTTPMDMRNDAGATAIRLAHTILLEFERQAGANTVWNIGKMAFSPGAANVVPGGAGFIFEFRDTDVATLDELEARLLELIDQASTHGSAGITATKTANVAPAPMDPAIGELIAAAATEAHAPPMRLPSGGGHDAMVLNRHLPSAMLFIPSIRGKSHDITEDTAEADIVLGCEVLARTVERLLA